MQLHPWTLVGETAYLGTTKGFEIVSTGRAFAKTLDSHYSRHRAGEDPVFYHAPAVLIAHAPSGSYFGRDDAIHALYNVELAAERMGLGSCQMGHFKIALDRDRSFQKAIELPVGLSPEAALAIGYPKVSYNRSLNRRKSSVQWIS